MIVLDLCRVHPLEITISLLELRSSGFSYLAALFWHSFSLGAGGIAASLPFLQSGISGSLWAFSASPLLIAGLSYAEEDLAILGS